MAVVDIQIQTGLNSEFQPRMVRGSDGTIYVVYTKVASPSYLFVAYSHDNGLTWTEVSSGFYPSNWPYPTLAIDSQDTLHIISGSNSGNDGSYRQFTISGGFTGVQTFGTDVASAVQHMDIAVDSADNVHVVWRDFNRIYYNKRTAGTWGTQLLVQTTSVSSSQAPKIAIAPNGTIFVVYFDSGIYYLKYTTFWTSGVSIGVYSSGGAPTPNHAIDSLGNVHVVWTQSASQLMYVKYTLATDTWGTPAAVSITAPFVVDPSIAIDASDNLNVVFWDANYDSWYVQNTGSWGTNVKILDGAIGGDRSYPQHRSTVYPIVGGASTNILISGIYFLYAHLVSGSNLRFYSSSGVTYPGTQTENYSREENASLPTVDGQLSNIFTATEVSNVAADDNIYTSQTATNKYAIQLFKNKGEASSDNINVTWIGKSNLAPTSSTVYLQIYNRTTPAWETLSSNNAAAANTEFTLTGTKSTSLSDYYDANLWVACRIYQLAV